MGKNVSRFLCVLLAAVLLTALAPAALAVEGEIILGANYEERFYQNEPRTWSFTPGETGEYLLFTPASGSLLGEIEGQTPTGQFTLQTGQAVQVYSLTAGTAYQVRIWLNPEQVGPYSDVFQLDKKQPLESLTLSRSEVMGQRDNYDSIYAELYPAYYPADELSWTTSDSSIVSIESTDGYECYFRMNKVGTATLTASIGGLRASCTVTVEKASGYWDNYEVWPVTQTSKEMALVYGQAASYTFTPTQTGTYVSHVSGTLHTMVTGTSPSHILNERMAHTMEGDYHLYDMVAGETYVVEVVPNYSEDGSVQKGTFLLEKARSAGSITLYGPNMTDGSKVVGYVGGMMDLYAMSDPIYAYALDGGYRFTSSNSAIAAPERESTDASNVIFLTEAGSCNITVTTGSAKAMCPVTVKPSPVLTVGKTTTLKFGTNDAYGVTCLFTPSESGNYTFVIKGSGGTCGVEDTEIGNFIYGSGSMSGWLQGGKTYKVKLGVGNSDHTVTVYGAGSVPPDVDDTDLPVGDEPATPSQPSDPSVPSDPADPSVPVTPSNPNVPADPSQPDEPDVKPEPEMEELADQLGGSYDGEKIHIQTQDDVFLFSSDQLSQMAQNDAALVVEGDDFRVEMDSTALDAIARQASTDVTLRVRPGQQDAFSDKQKDALKGKIVAGSVSLDLICDGAEIHDFGGGKAAVTVPFTPEGTYLQYAAYYLSPEGSLEKMNYVFWGDGTFTFHTGHFSDYVILQETPAEEAEQSDLLLPILIGVAAVVAVAALVTVVLTRKKK